LRSGIAKHLEERWVRIRYLAGQGAQQLKAVWRDTRQATAQARVSPLRVFRDLVILNATRGLGIRPYFQYRLFNPDLGREEQRRYLPDTPWANARLWSRLNPRQYGCLYANKLIFNRFFSAAGLPVAKLLGVYDPLAGYGAQEEPLRTPAELRAWLPKVAHAGFVFKAIEGVRGHSILVFTGPSPQDPARFATLSGDLYDAERLAAFAAATAELKQHRPGAYREAFLLEERIVPHPELAAFIGPTLCTVRIQTIIAVDGTAKVLAAVFKLQPKPLGVDHLIYGAVGCWVDIESGKLRSGRTREGLTDVTTIPGTQTSFVGFQLPDWAEAKSVALRAARVFPWARSIGWDVALSARGPVLIEGNADWSPSLIQMPAPYGLMTGDFEQLYRSSGY
jgi:hypothetical protein